MRSGVYKWLVVGMLWFICLFNYADRQAIFSVFTLLKDEMHLTDFQLGIVGSAFMWVYALALPLAGIVGDRVSRKTLILGGMLFWSLVTIATALSTDYWHLVLFRSLEGLGEAFYFPASMSLISDYHGRDTRSRAMSIHQSSVYAGTVLGGTAAGYFGQYYGWRSGFYIFGTLGIILACFLVFTLKEPRRGQAEDPAEEPLGHGSIRLGQAGIGTEILDIFRTRMVLVLMAVFIGANFVAMVFLTWMPSYLNRQFNMSLTASGLNATLWLQVASVLGVLSGGVLADRLVRRYPGGRMMTQAIGLFLGVPFLFLTGWTLSALVLVVALLGFGYFKGLYDANIWASLYDVVKPERRATALGFMNSLGWFGGAMGPIAIGWISSSMGSPTKGLSVSLSATSAIYFFVGVFLVWGIWKYMRNPSAHTPIPVIAPIEK